MGARTSTTVPKGTMVSPYQPQIIGGVSPVNADCVFRLSDLDECQIWRIEGPNVVSNRPSPLEAIPITKCRHPQQARLPLTDTRLYR